MANVTTCDLCGKPIRYDNEERSFKVKLRELKSFKDYSSFSPNVHFSWVYLDCHKDCVTRLFAESIRKKNKLLND